MTYSRGLALLYRELWTFVRKVWWAVLFLGFSAFLGEAIDSPLISQTWTDSQYMVALIFVTIFTLCSQLLVFYVLIRFLALQGDVKNARALSSASLLTFAPFALAYVVWRFLLSFARNEIGEWWGLAEFVVFPLLALWAVSAPGGMNVITPIASIKAMVPRLFWSFGFLIVALLPLVLLSLAPPLAFALGWSEADWASVFFGGLRVLHDIANHLLLFGSIYVIARNAGLKTQAAPHPLERPQT